jgi:Methylamine utilisation protein MauE
MDRKYLLVVQFLIRISLGCVLLYGSISILQRPFTYLEIVYQYELLGPKSGMIVAMIIPWAELIIALCLISGVSISGAAFNLMGLSILFTGAQAYAIQHEFSIRCGCLMDLFLRGADPINYYTIMGTALIGILSLGLIIIQFKGWELSKIPS